MYVAVNDGAGDEATPKTALFELYQLEQLANNQLPAFGVIATETPGFTGSYDADNDRYFVSFTSGEVGYNGQRLVVPAQKVALRRVFADTYGSGYIYGVRVGFSLAEASRATQSYSTITSSSTSTYASELPVADISLVESLGFPVSAHVNNVFVRFSGVNAAGTALVVDPSYDNGTGLVSDPNRYGKIVSSVPSGSRVYFIYEPKLSVLYGLPVVFGGTNPESFYYMPPMPDTWLPIADMLAGTPEDPELTTDSGDPVILRTVEEYPAPDAEEPLFDSADANTISRASRQTRIAIRQARDNASVANMLAALEEYTAAVADSSDQDFRTFWSTRPFKPTSYFARGISFAGLERFSFGANFNRAYFNIRQVDLQHTFAIFRGDLFDYSYGIVGDAPTNVTATSFRSDLVRWSGTSSSMSRGTYIYGVSAVTNNGETPVTYSTAVASYASPTYFVNHIEFDEVPGALFYHIYRRSNLVGDQIDYRLTDVDEVTGFGTSSIADLVYDAPRTMSTGYEAIKFVANGTRLQAVRLQLYTTADITNTSDYLSFSVYTNSSNLPGSVVGTSSDTVTFGSLTAAVQEVIVKGDWELTDGSTYWLVIHRSAAPTGGSIKLAAADDTATGQYATATTPPFWTLTHNLTAYFQPLYGYLDYGVAGNAITQRGLRLTGDIALEPRRLRVYVPDVEGDELLVRGRNPVVGLNAEAAGDLTDPESTPTKNELIVQVTARSGETGTPQTFTTIVPRGTVRGTEFVLGSETDLFDRVDEVLITPGSDLSMDSNNRIAWSMFDFVTVETVP
ncbi:MAG: hypothetical protein JSS66_05000 [Armatimonadetes bacterium]|nr:hypothetical protein [Armatimonadota bacterium]